MLYDRPHVRLASLPGMYERTITVSSSGKTFSVTGWKIGWAVGPEYLIKGLILTNQWVQFSVSTPAQHAIAMCLQQADQPYEGHESYYAWLNAQYVRKRDMLMKGLREAGLFPVAPEGGFFIIADTSNINVPESHMAVTTKAAPVMRRDWAFCRFLTLEHKVAAIPPSAFFEGWWSLTVAVATDEECLMLLERLGCQAVYAAMLTLKFCALARLSSQAMTRNWRKTWRGLPSARKTLA